MRSELGSTSKPSLPKAASHGAIKHYGPQSSDAVTPSAKSEKSGFDYNLPGADGLDVPVSRFKGKYLLVVNLGRKSMYDVQLLGLIKVGHLYKEKGLIVIGVPSNDFGAAEPGTVAEVQKAYMDAKVDFPVMAVSKLSGEETLPFFSYLTKSEGAPGGGPVHWNYTKFIVDTKGKVVARLDPDVAPDSAEMLSVLDQVTTGTYKPAKPSAKHSSNDSLERDED